MVEMDLPLHLSCSMKRVEAGNRKLTIPKSGLAAAKSHLAGKRTHMVKHSLVAHSNRLHSLMHLHARQSTLRMAD